MNLYLIWTLKLKQIVEEGLILYRSVFIEMKNQKTVIMMYFHKVTWSVPANPALLPPPPALLCHHETARPTSPLPPPLQTTQHGAPAPASLALALLPTKAEADIVNDSARTWRESSLPGLIRV